MATAEGDSTPYGGGGAGGKFHKKPSLRRPQMTPYDRPPTALRTNNNGGWLSRISDPASKLISATARKLFSSLSRKRVLPPPDEKVQLSENHLRDVITEDPSRTRDRDMNEGKTQINGSLTDEDVQLEHILKTKTFTWSEMDHITTLMHSRTVDKTGKSGEEGFKGTKPSELSAGNFSRKEYDCTLRENRFDSSEVPRTYVIPSKRLKVTFDDVASPAELAKAYMGSRSTKVSLSRLDPRIHAAREETPAQSSFQLQRPTMSTVQKPLNTAGTSQNDFVIPRSQGRSAIYNMARTPYFRASGTSNDASHGCHGQSLSSQKAHKRRSSILEHDIGSVGPIRRIRQKSNLLYPKTLQLPSSRMPLPHATPSKVGKASLYSSSKSQEGRGDKSLSVSSSRVSSKSIEMGERILLQLEKLNPPRENSSAKKSGAFGGMPAMELTPGILHGQACKSSETGGSLTLLQSDQVNFKNVDPHAAPLCEVQDSTPRKRDNVHDSSSRVLMNPSYKIYPENNEAGISNNDFRAFAKTTGPLILKPSDDVAKKSQAVQITSHEDCLELEASSMHTSSHMLLENSSFPEAAKEVKPYFPDIKPSLKSVLRENISTNSSTSADKGISQSFATDDVSKKRNDFSAPSCQPAMSSQTYLSDKADDSPATISFGLKKSVKTTPVSFFPSSVVESSTPKDVKSQCPSSVFPFAADATDTALKLPGSNYKTTEAVKMSKESDNTLSLLPGSTTSTISFKIPAKTSTGNIDSLGSCSAKSAAPPPFLFLSQSSSSGTSAQSNFTPLTTTTINAGVSAKEVGGDANGSVAATINISSSDSTSSVAFPSFQSGPKSGISLASDSVDQETSGTETVTNSKEIAIGRVNSSNLSAAAASASTPNSAVVGFKFGAMMTSSTRSQLQATDNFSRSSQQVLPPTSVASAVQSIPIQPAPISSSSISSTASCSSTSSAMNNIFGGSWQPSNSQVSGSTINNSSAVPSFVASSASTPSSSASSGFVLRTSSVSSAANGSLATVPFEASSSSVVSGSTTSVFTVGSSPTFAASTTIFSPFTFGSSSASATATCASVFQFGSVAFSPASTTLQPSQPGSSFVNGSSVFAFGTTAPPSAIHSNDQMSMDTMVEDAMQSLAPTAATSTFGQSPTSNLGFGMAQAPSGPNPFQLGMQQNQFAATQNPFQASGGFDGGSFSLGAEGSFSLGAGGNNKSNRRIVKVRNRIRKK